MIITFLYSISNCGRDLFIHFMTFPFFCFLFPYLQVLFFIKILLVTLCCVLKFLPTKRNLIYEYFLYNRSLSLNLKYIFNGFGVDFTLLFGLELKIRKLMQTLTVHHEVLAELSLLHIKKGEEKSKFKYNVTCERN